MLRLTMEQAARLSREAIDSFKYIYREEFGETLSDGEAEEMALRVLRLYSLLQYRHPPVMRYDDGCTQGSD